MKKNIKVMSIILCLIVAVSSFCACTKKEKNGDNAGINSLVTTNDSYSSDEQTEVKEA